MMRMALEVPRRKRKRKKKTPWSVSIEQSGNTIQTKTNVGIIIKMIASKTALD